MLGNIPNKVELDRLLRYEGAIERQFYKALGELERLQRLRAGENVFYALAFTSGARSERARRGSRRKDGRLAVASRA